MNNLQDVWSKRFNHYMTEVQKYMRFVFTGHLAIVLVFVIGAVGYQYSEWLKVVDATFPAEWIVALAIGFLLALSRPVTLLREPDQVYLLPLESKMTTYFSSALKWTFWSQIGLAIVIYIVAIPLLKAVTELSSGQIWLCVAVIIVLKYLNVHIEFNYRYANRGASLSIDRMARGVLSILTIQSALTEGYSYVIIFIILLFVYNRTLAKKVKIQPIPYEHFVKVEQNRMMGFYRFANYFTDVPHLHGSIRRRGWLNFIYSIVQHNQNGTQSYLVYRTFIRTDDHFYLWVRLTAISGLIALLVNIPIVTWVVAGALSFATTIQLKYALLSSGDFRMDRLYPVHGSQRKNAVRKVLRLFMVIQAIIVMLCSVGQPLFFVTGILIVAVGELTFLMTKDPSREY
ncbi:ABC transporter permease [Ureibacillus sinduriensis]|uniref:Protein EcsB n=1 Tax=Ureibacillus sinduriensis BLB-1 = JCM 15800 TaxID=1384057 RepID=A0A0A3HX60_9BACL|nr:ABC transporter permease [Ureibacillus sinduriensis]KGR75775.1 protein EcsB [Ureibacillus sinduriensis BLB-1 = JCM 15800]